MTRRSVESVFFFFTHNYSGPHTGIISTDVVFFSLAQFPDAYSRSVNNKLLLHYKA